jgi:hypothetical protein
VVLVLHLSADVMEVALPKERDEQIANRVVGRGISRGIRIRCPPFFVHVPSSSCTVVLEYSHTSVPLHLCTMYYVPGV